MDSNSDPPSNFENKNSLMSPPPSFMCPISHEIMHDPVSCADGHSYERDQIERWLAGNSKSPLTGALLPTKDVTSNHALCNLIQEWQERSRCEVEVDENTSPPGGSNSNAQSKRSRISKGGGGKKKQRRERRAFRGCGWRRVIPDATGDRSTQVGGCWFR
jgi:hypothetical protein